MSFAFSRVLGFPADGLKLWPFSRDWLEFIFLGGEVQVMSKPEEATVLIVEDDDDLREVLAFGIETEGYHVIQAESGNKALALMEAADAKKIDVILSDVRMPEGDGISFLKALRAKGSNYPAFIFLTGYADIGNDAAVKLGARRLINKPFSLNEVISELDEAIHYDRKNFA